jgi:O-antigen biosynthesis protein
VTRTPRVEIAQSSLHCVVDSFDDGVILGWAHDPRSPRDSERFFVVVDGEQTMEVVCQTPRPDVANAGLAPENVGYRASLPRKLLDGQRHHVEFRDIRRRPVKMRVNDKLADFFDFTYVWRPKIRSFVDGMRSGGLEGWVLQVDYDTGKLQGNCMVRVTCDGATIGHTRANRVRADVGRTLSAPPQCGFRFVPPQSMRRGYPQTYRFYLMPGDIELEQSPVVASLITDDGEARLLELSDAIDKMHVEMTRLRRKVRELLPQPVFTVANYDEWYRLYAKTLTRRVAETRPSTKGAQTPLVSVICPVYRPELTEFKAAVASVQAQTYQNWELILVDDGSGDPALTKCITTLTKSDSRIKAQPMAANGGISLSTNAGLKAASGEWIAFFDHDDLLTDVALETMVRAAQATGAKVLYSDEDKVDMAGNFSAPAFKPDWNHRLMLGVNYVCHLLFVAKPELDQVGPLRSKYDGAQDHDLILRLAEHLDPSQIHHVPEILYHWRITANSTASDVGAKPYAIEAGLACIRDHLKRLGRKATVTNMQASTLYHQKWKYSEEPQVEIIIPFKDEIATTSQCIEAILSQTRYRNYKITLIDNWSTSSEAQSFTEEITKLRNVRVIRVEEPFNYSRLNNLAAQASTAEFLVLMNNDLFVNNSNWLRVCVDEALADPKVAIVGGKFYYPTRTVQHAGIVMGLGGVAGHVGIGLPEDDFGYGGRLMFSQEYSGVTAAGMLVRRSVFEAVGGLDEKHLTIAFNDVDLCLKVRAAGYKVIWTPDFTAIHHESLSRGDDERPAQETRFFHESEVMKERWGSALLRDPFYNKNFSLDRAPYTELLPPDTTAGQNRDGVASARPPAPPARPASAQPVEMPHLVEIEVVADAPPARPVRKGGRLRQAAA